MNNYTYLFKYIIIGNASVGKSCLLMQFLQNKFKLDSQTTVGVQFGSKNITIQGSKIKLQIWDTAGQQIFKSITRSYYKGSIGALLVYDITSKSSFKDLQKWINQTKTYANQKLSMILIGNKSDLSQKRQVSQAQGREFAQKYGLQFMQCTAMDNQKTQRVFVKLAEIVLYKIATGEVDPKSESMGIKIGTFHGQLQQLRQSKKYCC